MRRQHEVNEHKVFKNVRFVFADGVFPPFTLARFCIRRIQAVKVCHRREARRICFLFFAQFRILLDAYSPAVTGGRPFVVNHVFTVAFPACGRKRPPLLGYSAFGFVALLSHVFHQIRPNAIVAVVRVVVVQTAVSVDIARVVRVAGVRGDRSFPNGFITRFPV